MIRPQQKTQKKEKLDPFKFLLFAAEYVGAFHAAWRYRFRDGGGQSDVVTQANAGEISKDPVWAFCAAYRIFF